MVYSFYIFIANLAELTFVLLGNQMPWPSLSKEMIPQDPSNNYFVFDAAGIFFCGAVSLLTFFILFVYLKNKERIYFYYVLFLFFMLFYGFLHIESHSALQSYLELRLGGVNRFIEPVTFLAFSSYIFFSVELIDVKKQNKRLYRLLNVFNYSVAAYSILYFIFYSYLTPYLYEFYIYSRVIIYPLCTFFMGWIILKISSPAKNYFLIGSTAYFLGAVIASIRYTIIDIPIEGFYSIPAPIYCEIGILIEILCFALALGHRIYYLHFDKQIANDKLIYQLSINERMVQNMNIKLENEIKDRTREIIEAQEMLRKQEKEQLQTRYEADMIKTEMLAHRLQVNSHLQFNCLNAIKYLVQIGENEKAVKYLVLFSRFIRTIQETSDRRMIPLSEEFEIIENFIKLEKNRFSDNFTYEITGLHLEEFNNLYTPPLLLQPFVDNAIWHGLLQSSKENKTLKININPLTNGAVKITIDDNGIGREKANEITRKRLHKSMGIHLTEERIKLYNHFYHDIIHFEIIDKLDNDNQALGTRIEITLNNHAESITAAMEL